MTSAGLQPTEQMPVDAVARVTVDDRPVTELWEALVTPALGEQFVSAVRRSAAGRSPSELYDALDAADVPYHLQGPIDRVARGDRPMAWRLVAEYLPTLGQGRTSVADLLATVKLFEALEVSPTLAVSLQRDEFEALRRDQRVDICRLLGRLARAFDVRLECSRVDRLWLAHHHREDLPGVSEWCTTAPTEVDTDAALADLDPDGLPVTLLRTLESDAGGTLTYHELYATTQRGDSRVRQCLSTLSDYGLVEPFGPDSARRVSIRDAGRDVLAEFGATVGEQQTLTGGVSKPPKTTPTGRVTTRTQDRGDSRGCYRTRWTDPVGHGAAAGPSTADGGGISLVQDDIDDLDAQTHLLSYNEGRDEALVSVHATGPYSLAVSLAVALASPRFLDSVFGADGLATILDDAAPAVLRDSQCLGWLGEDEIDEAGALRDRLVKTGERLASLTTDGAHGEYEDRDSHRGETIRLAHGLAGTIAGLVSHTETELIREIRVPSGLSTDKLDALAVALARTLTIQSQYDGLAAYRQLVETRDDKRASAPTADVDAADPTGELIGEVILRGADVHRLRGPVEKALSGQHTADDAPEFNIPIPIQTPGRAAFDDAVRFALDAKNIRVNERAVSVLHALVKTPYAVTRALAQLAVEDRRREVRADDLRYALSHLDADEILADLSPTVGRLVAALITAEKPLTQAALADEAGVSTQSVRNHRDKLTALDIVHVEGTEWRLALSFAASDERQAGTWPSTAVGETRLRGTVDELLLQTLPPDRYGDPDDPVASAVHWPPDPWGLLDTDGYSEWLRLAGRLTNTPEPDTDAVTVRVGPEIEQTPLQATNENIGSSGGIHTAE